MAIKIDVLKDGPLIVDNLPKLNNSEGNEVPVDEKIALCRCGKSQNKPFCDGAHRAYNEENGTNYSPFQASEETLGIDLIYVWGCGKRAKRERGIPFCDGSQKEK